MKPSNSIAMHHQSQSIAKLKPKVRIVHVLAPEIIKTDVENFRELVQRLTGKPAKRMGRTTRRRPEVTGGEVVVASNGSEGVKRESEEENCDGFGDIDGLFQGLGDLPLLPLGSSKCWM